MSKPACRAFFWIQWDTELYFITNLVRYITGHKTLHMLKRYGYAHLKAEDLVKKLS